MLGLSTLSSFMVFNKSVLRITGIKIKKKKKQQQINKQTKPESQNQYLIFSGSEKALCFCEGSVYKCGEYTTEDHT